MMKSIYFLAAFCFVVAASALNHDRSRHYKPHRQAPPPSADSLEKRLRAKLEQMDAKGIVKLKEYLNNLEEPHPLYRSPSNNHTDGCADVCGDPPTTDNNSTKCASDRWVPNYVANGDCECLAEYKCCPAKCPAVDVESCWNNGKKGLKYGKEEVDCCGCKVIKCEDCAPPASPESICPTTRPAHCYTYKGTAANQNLTECFVASCKENPSDAPPDAVCDSNCLWETESMSSCRFPHITCSPFRNFRDCPRRTKAQNTPELPLTCYESPMEVVDLEGGHFYKNASQQCEECTKWAYSKLSCDVKNTAAEEEDCHLHGKLNLDKKCFTKRIEQDTCLCDNAICSSSHGETEAIFGVDEVCPKDHVKLQGVSICNIARDLCKPCPKLNAMAPGSCTYGKVVKTEDCNGCPVNECKMATIPEVSCSSNFFELDPDNNELQCKECPPITAMAAADCPLGKVVKKTDSFGCPYYECQGVTIPDESCPCKSYVLNSNDLKCKCKGYRRGSDGFYYKFHSETTTWHQANFRCAQEGAHLVMVKSSTTHNYIRSTWPRKSFWIALHDITNEGKFEWFDGSSLVVSYWGPGEPNNSGSLGNQEDCTHYYGNDMWNDMRCSYKTSYLCQIIP